MREKVNLWEETTDILRIEEKTWSDIQYVYGDEFQITKANFEQIAQNTNYYPEIYLTEVKSIAEDITLRGKDFILVREALVDSLYEEWHFIKIPTDKIVINQIVEYENLLECLKEHNISLQDIVYGNNDAVIYNNKLFYIRGKDYKKWGCINLDIPKAFSTIVRLTRNNPNYLGYESLAELQYDLPNSYE